MKKFKKLFLVLVLMLSVQVAFKPIKAVAVTLRYFDTNTHVFNGTSSTIHRVVDGLSQIKDATSFSFVTRYSTNSISTSEYHSLFFVGKDNMPNDYVNVYLKPSQGSGSRIGVELRKGSDNKSYYVDTKKLNDGEMHSIAFTIEKGVGYAFYVDGERVKSISEENVRFINGSVSTPTYFSFGGGFRGSANGYYAKGKMENTRLYIETLTPKDIEEVHINDSIGSTPIFEKKNIELSKDHPEEAVHFSSNSTSHSINTTFKFNNTSRFDLLTLRGDRDEVRYFVNPEHNKVGLKINDKDYEISTQNGLLSMEKWHSIAYVLNREENQVKIYLNKKLLGETEINISDLELNKLRISSENEKLDGSIERLYIYDKAINQNAINTLHTVTDYYFEKIVDPKQSYSSEKIRLFHDGYDGARKYRIPSLLTTNKGTVLAAIDQRHQHHLDWGNIDLFLRRSTDGGKTWDKGKKLIDLIDNEKAGQEHSAFLIDASMVQDRTTNRIYLLVDMFPESRGFFTVKNSDPGTDTVEVEGKKYQRLKDTSNTEYYVKEDGKVYKKSDNTLTNYTVTVKAEAPYRTLGDLYESGVKVGNIMMKSSPLRMQSTARLWLTYSDDDGENWEQPIDITSQVKEEWMRFMGTGPGVGIQAKNGRLIFPVYYTNMNNMQNSAVIYSDDHGSTWKRGESPNDGRDGIFNSKSLWQQKYEITESQVIQLNNGHLKLFMRNNFGTKKVLVATSTDNGETWNNTLDFYDIAEPYCQMSVIHYGDVDGQEFIIFSNPNDTGSRRNGTLRIGKVEGDSITFTHSQVITQGDYAYSSITKLKNGNIGVLYEGENLDINYMEVDLNWIKAPLVDKPAEKPKQVGLSARLENGKLKMNINFDQKVLIGSYATLGLSLSGFDETAEYISGSGTNTLTFEYPIKGDEFGKLLVKRINGVAEGVYGHAVDVAIGEVYNFDIIPQSQYVVSVNNFQTGEGAKSAVDGNLSTLWHSRWDKYGATPHEFLIDLQQEYDVTKLIYVPRQDGQPNGIVTKYRIESSNDNVDYKEVISGDLDSSNDVKIIEIPQIKTRYIKFVSLEGAGGYSSASEFYIQKATVVTRQADKDALISSYDKLKQLKIDKYTKETLKNFEASLKLAKNVIDEKNVTQDKVNSTLENLNSAFNELKEREINEQSEKGVKVKFLSETFEDDDVTLSVEKKQGNNIRDSYEISFTKDGNKVQPINNQVVEVTLPRKLDQEVLKIEHDHEGTIEEITDFTLGEGTITFNTSKFSGFTIVYRPPVLALTELDKGVENFNSLSKADYEEVGYNALKSKLDEINIKLKDVANPLNQTELDALVAELQSMFDALVKKENKPVEKADETTTKPDTKSEVKPSDTTQSTATIKPVAKANETIAKSDIKSEVKPSDTPAKDDAKADVDTGDSTNVLASLIVLLISAMAILALRKKMK